MGFISGGKYYSSGRSWSDEQRRSSRTTSNPASSSVEQLAAGGNTAAQEYLNTGGLNPNQNVTDSAGNPLSAQDITGMVAGGYLPRTGGGGVYNVSSGSQAKAQTLYSGIYGGTGGVTDGSGTNGGYSVLGGGSDGSNFGSSGGGWNPGGSTRFDSAGNVIIGTMGGRNIIRGATDVDRTAALNNASNPYAMFTDPNYFINRSEDIRKQVERQMQGTIDAINQRYEGQVRREEEAGAEDLARQRSMNLRAGLGGSDFGAANKAEVRNRTNANVRDIQAQQDIAVGNAMLQIEQIAQNRIQMEQTAMQNAFTNTLAVQQLQNQQEEQARTLIKDLGAAGLDIATIKERDPALYASVIKASGLGEVAAGAMMNAAKAKAEQIDYQYKYSGGKLVAFGVNPLTGKLSVMEQEVDLPENYEVITMDNGMVYGKPENWDGELSSLKPIGNYAKPKEVTLETDFSFDDLDPDSGSILAQTGLSYGAYMVLTGQMSKLSRDAKTRNAAMKEAEAFANANGVDISTFASQYEALNKTIQFNTIRQSMAQVQENEIIGTLENMEGVTGDMSKLNFANVLKIWAGQQINDPVAQRYAFHLEQLRNEMVAYNQIAQGQINADGSLKQSTDADMNRAAEIIKSGIASGGLSGLKKAVEDSTGKMKPVLEKSVNAGRLGVWTLFGVGENFKASVGTTNSAVTVESQAQELMSAPVGSIVEFNGQKYIKMGPNDFQPASNYMSVM